MSSKEVYVGARFHRSSTQSTVFIPFGPYYNQPEALQKSVEELYKLNDNLSGGHWDQGELVEKYQLPKA